MGNIAASKLHVQYFSGSKAANPELFATLKHGGFLQIDPQALKMESLNSDQMDGSAQPKCPLCGSLDTVYQTKIDAESIADLYGKDRRNLVSKELQGTSWVYVYDCHRCFLYFFEPKLEGSPAFYESLQSLDWYYSADKPEFEMASKRVPRNARLLEVGCGAGWFAKRLVGGQYTGLEYSESAAQAARAGGLDVRTQSVQEHSLTHKSAYQVVCAFQVLEHVADPASFIAACIDCLEPNGLLIYAVPSNDSYLQFLPNDPLNLPPHHLTRWPDKTLETIPNFFPVDLVAIEHEVVSDIHLRTFVSTMIRRKLNSLLGWEDKMVDCSFGARLVGRCSHVLAAWSSTIFKDAVFRPRGNAVIATYQKQSPAASK